MFRSISSKVKDYINNFLSEPLSKLEFWIPTFMVIIPFVVGLIGYIKFVIKGGYVLVIKSKEGVFSNWSEWPFDTIFSKIVGEIVVALILAEFIIVMIYYFKNSNKFKKIAMIVVSVIFGIQIILTVTIFNNILTEYLVTKYIGRDMISSVENIPIDPVLAIKTYLIITIGSFLLFLILIFITKECRRVIGKFLKGIAITCLAVPLVFWILYNIIQLFFGILTLVIAIGVICFISSDSSGGGSRYKVYDRETGRDIGDVEFIKRD